MCKGTTMMKPETLMWLFPIMFMLHDFEEIIMMRPWGHRYTVLLNDRLPSRLRKLSNKTLNLSTNAFALAVMCILIAISIMTYMSVELGMKWLWTGTLIVYFVHLLIHLGQGIFLKNYVPAVITSILTGIYCLYAFWYAANTFNLSWAGVATGVATCLILVVPVLAGAVWLAGRFDPWLRGYERK
jgi:hypothetical protein